MVNIRDESQETEFNASVATLIRIDEIKKYLDQATSNMDEESMFRYLFSYYKELECIFNDKDQEEQQENYISMVYLYRQRRKRIRLKKKVISYFYDINKWERDLRRLEQKYGMNMPKKADARFALMGKR